MAYLFVTKEWFAFQKLIGKHDYYIIVKPSGEQPAPCGNVVTEEVIKWTTYIHQQNNRDARQGLDISHGLGQGVDQGPADGRDQEHVEMPDDGFDQQRVGLGGGGGQLGSLGGDSGQLDGLGGDNNRNALIIPPADPSNPAVTPVFNNKVYHYCTVCFTFQCCTNC